MRVHRGFRYGQCKHIPGTFSLHRAPTIECVEELFQEAMKERKEYELAQLRSARMLSYNVAILSSNSWHKLDAKWNESKLQKTDIFSVDLGLDIALFY